MQGTVPSNRIGEDFELGVVGWNSSSRFILKPQWPVMRKGSPEVWNMLQLQVHHHVSLLVKRRVLLIGTSWSPVPLSCLQKV